MAGPRPRRLLHCLNALPARCSKGSAAQVGTDHWLRSSHLNREARRATGLGPPPPTGTLPLALHAPDKPQPSKQLACVSGLASKLFIPCDRLLELGQVADQTLLHRATDLYKPMAPPLITLDCPHVAQIEC